MTGPGTRRLAILAALSREIMRQGYRRTDDLNLDELADAVERALDRPESVDVDDLSREPDELNAANDI